MRFKTETGTGKLRLRRRRPSNRDVDRYHCLSAPLGAGRRVFARPSASASSGLICAHRKILSSLLLLPSLSHCDSHCELESARKREKTFLLSLSLSLLALQTHRQSDNNKQSRLLWAQLHIVRATRRIRMRPTSLRSAAVAAPSKRQTSGRIAPLARRLYFTPFELI